MAFAGVVAVGGFVDVGAAVNAEVDAERVGEEGGVNHGEDFFVELGRIVAKLGVIIFLQGVIHGVDSGFALIVAGHGVHVGFLDEEKDHEQSGEGADDHKF